MENELLEEIAKLEVPLEDLLEVYEFEEKQKDEFIIDIGNIEKNYYFITNGIVRSYCVKNNGDEVILNFYFNNSFISSLISLTEQKPAFVGFQCLSDTQYVKINREKVERLGNQYPKFGIYVRDKIIKTAMLN